MLSRRLLYQWYCPANCPRSEFSVFLFKFWAQAQYGKDFPKFGPAGSLRPIRKNYRKIRHLVQALRRISIGPALGLPTGAWWCHVVLAAGNYSEAGLGGRRRLALRWASRSAQPIGRSPAWPSRLHSEWCCHLDFWSELHRVEIVCREHCGALRRRHLPGGGIRGGEKVSKFGWI